jgi:hypothetical protein
LQEIKKDALNLLPEHRTPDSLCVKIASNFCAWCGKAEKKMENWKRAQQSEYLILLTEVSKSRPSRTQIGL